MEGYPPETGGDTHGKQDKSDFTGPWLAGPGRAGGLGRTRGGAGHCGRTGRIWRDRVRRLACRAGLQRILICGAPGAAAGAAMSGPGTRLARVVGGGIGGIVAGSFALASGEVMPPGTILWALGGAAYAAVFA